MHIGTGLDMGSGASMAVGDRVSEPYRYGDRIEQVVRHHATRRPQAVALQQGDATISYQELVARSGAVAAGLRAAGVGAGAYVPVRMERGIDFVTVLLGVLRAGACYIALDTEWPDHRIRHILESCRGHLVVDNGHLDRWLASDHGATPDIDADGSAAACVFYTSGSTGAPKGAVSPHRGTIRTLVDNPTFALDQDTVFLQAAPLPWDALSLELWAPLLNGGRCVLLDRGRTVLDTETSASMLDRGVNSMWLTSSLFNLFADERPSLFRRLRLLLVGGERVSPAHVRRVRNVAPTLHVVNGYGPVENTIFTTTHVIRDVDVAETSSEVPIGRPVPRTAVILLDRDGNEVPPGAPGELATAGDGLALGYLGDPDETARRFFLRDGLRYYRTGDLAVLDEDGNYRFRGRVDRQFKVRGVRIEPGEVESLLERHPRVAAAYALRLPVEGGDALLGCLYTTMDSEPVDPDELRAFLAQMCPPAMRPTRLVHVLRLPLTTNGKVDDRAATAMCTPPATQHGNASGDADPLVLEIGQLLSLPDLTADTDVLAAGATSLDVIRLAARVSSHTGHPVTASDVYRTRTLTRLRAHSSSGRPTLYTAVDDVSQADGEAPLSHAQQRFWLAELTNPGLADNMIVLAYDISGPLHAPALESALNDLVHANPVLRTIYPEVDDLPVQRLLMPPDVQLPLTRCPAPGGAGRTVVEVAEQATADWWAQPFALDRDLPIRARLYHLERDRHLLCINVHHIAFDGWSEMVFVRQLTRAFQDRLAGREPRLDAGPGPAAYSRWEQQHLDGWRTAEVPFWRELLRDLPRPFLPRPAGAVDAPRVELTHRVAPRAVARLHTAASRHGVPMTATVIAATARSLARTFDVDEMCLGTVTNGRSDPSLEDLVGYMVNPLALPLRGGNGPAAQVLTSVGRQLIAALDHAQTPFDELVRVLGADRGRHPWFQVWSVLQSAPPRGHLSYGVTIRSLRIRPPRTGIELMVEAIPDADGGWTVVQLRRADAIDDATASRIHDELRTALADTASLGQWAS